MNNAFLLGNHRKRIFGVAGVLAMAVGAIGAPAIGHAAEGPSKVYKLTPPPGGGTDPNSSGFAAVRSDPTGPDSMLALFTGLAAKQCYGVFLTNSVVSG